MPTTRTLQQAFPIVAAALGRKFGVAVQVGGSTARTDGHVIHLPALPEDPALQAVAWGYLAHEAAHVRYTDFPVYAAGSRECPLQARLLNRLEDVRIERALAGPYPGTRASIEAVLAHLLRSGRLGPPAPDSAPAQVLLDYVLLSLRREVLGQRLLEPGAAQAETVLRATFPASFVRRLRGLLAEAAYLQSTTDALALARRIRALLEEEAQARAPGQPPPPGEEAAAAAADGAGAQLPGNPEEGGAPPATAGDAPAPGAEPAGPDRAAGGNLPAARAEEVDGAAPAPAGASAAGPGEPGRQRLAAVLATQADALPPDLFALVAGELGDRAVPGEPVLPVAEDWAGDAGAGRLLCARVEADSAALRARLQGLVQARRQDRTRAVRQGRRLDGRRLYRAAAGDGRIFTRRATRRAPATAVHLLVDLSGSMDRSVRQADGGAVSRAALAQEAALALGLALETLPGVVVEISAFPGRGGRADRVTRLGRAGGSVHHRAGAFLQEARGGTPLTAALWYAAARLLLQPQPRRLLLVLTDGVPDDAHSARSLLGRCRAAGLEPVGIGIRVDVSHLFPVAVRIEAVADLQRGLFGVAERLMGVA